MIERLGIGCVVVAFLVAEVIHPTHWQPKSLSPSSLVALGKPAELTGVALDDLPPIAMPALGNIDQVSHSTAAGEWAHLDSGATVRLNANIRLAGWMAEPNKDVPGSGLILIVDGTRRFNVSKSYGEQRPDVSHYYSNPALTPTGFNVVVPATLLGAGRHDLQLALISADSAGYYLFPIIKTVVVV